MSSARAHALRPVKRRSPRWRSPRWHRLNFVLAAFDVITVCISLSIDHRLIGSDDEALTRNRFGASQVASLDAVSQVADACNAPGNEVLETRAVFGDTATATLRAEGFRIPIEALTARVMTSERQKCLDAGCDELASKPIRRQVLHAIIAATLERGRSSGDAAAAA